MSIVIATPAPRIRVRAAVIAAAAGLPLLRAEDLDVGDDGRTVLHAPLLEVGADEVVAITGDAGPWATALTETLAGVRRSLGGRILFRGRDVTHREAHHAAGLGLRLVPSPPRTFPEFSVYEHVALSTAGAITRASPRARRQAVEEALAHFPVLRERAKQPASSLTEAERVLLALAQARAAGAALIVLDDPLPRIPAPVADTLLRLLATRGSLGAALLIAESAPARAAAIADHVYVVDGDRLVATGPPIDRSGPAPAGSAT